MKIKLKFEYVSIKNCGYKHKSIATNLDSLATDNFNITPYMNTYPINGWVFVYANQEDHTQCIGKIDLTMKVTKLGDEKYKYIHLSNLYVLPVYQNYNIGSTLLNYSLNIAKDNNCEMISAISSSDIKLDDLKNLNKLGYDIINNEIKSITQNENLQNKLKAYKIASNMSKNPLPKFYSKNNFLILRTPFNKEKVKIASPEDYKIYLKPITTNKDLFNKLVSNEFLNENVMPEFVNKPINCSKFIAEAMQIKQ